MKISAITTRESFETVKALGLLTEKEIQAVEVRLQKLESKPTVMDVNVETVLSTGTSWKGQEYKTGVFTKKNEGRNGAFVSTFFRPGYKSMCYIDTPELPGLVEALIQHIGDLEAQGYKFPSKG
jgi:hypothetical protein